MTREAGFASPGPEASGYSSESSRNTTIANEKKARKAVEEDAARLHNRVTTLQKEEQKAQKRLDETRRKARDLLELRAQNERRQLEREERQQQLQTELAAQRQDFGSAKEKSFQKKVKVEKRAYMAKMTSAVQTKEERLENEQRLAEYKLSHRLNALEKKDAVKKSMMKSQHKLDSYRMQRIQATHADYEHRLQEEVNARLLKEQELQHLSGVEIELIERLKKKQVEQQQALQELQEAMALTSRSASPALVCLPLAGLHCNISERYLAACLCTAQVYMPRSFTLRASRNEDVV